MKSQEQQTPEEAAREQAEQARQAAILRERKRIFIKQFKRAFEESQNLSGHGSAKEIAKRLNVTPQAVGKWLREDDNFPKVSTVLEISHLTGYSIDRLLRGDKTVIYPIIPLFRPKNNHDEHRAVEQINSPVQVANGFAVVCNDPSMLAPPFSEGMTLIFDKDLKPKEGDFVYAQLALETPVYCFRRLIRDLGQEVLVPLVPNYEKFSGKFEVLGTLIHAGLAF